MPADYGMKTQDDCVSKFGLLLYNGAPELNEQLMRDQNELLWFTYLQLQSTHVVETLELMVDQSFQVSNYIFSKSLGKHAKLFD